MATKLTAAGEARQERLAGSADGGPVAPDSAIVGGYRPWLDGLRAVAVLLVVVQHTLGQIPVELGSLGVGLFFALSGYLITSLLLDERALRGSVSLRRFYLRRAARLVPALVAVVVVCDAFFALQGDGAALKASLYALTYTANYAQVVGEDLVPAFGPTWSLAVEEHFYILWPLALLWFTRRYGLRSALWATVGVCFAALAWRATLAELHAQTLIDLGSFERADALLYGCAAAIAVRLGWRPRQWMLWAGAAAVASAAYVAYGHVIVSAVVAVGAAAVVVGLDYAAPTWLRRWLSGRALVTIGILSYGIYLWHGALMHVASNAGYVGRGWRTVVVLVTFAVAAVSYRCLEAPIRLWARRRSARPVPSPGAAMLPD
jgi:peptidoglycan/LPS O-acetylase OafA/YrhL